MLLGFILILLLIMLFILIVFYFFIIIYGKIQQKQQDFIASYAFPYSVKKRVAAKYPYLSNEEVEHVFEGLRTYFHLCNVSHKEMLAMPSKAVDTAWHEFILFTRIYEEFSKKAMGRFLHHTPTEAIQSEKVSNKSIRHVWSLSCVKEGISRRNPDKLPLLFSIDKLLGIEDGFKYSLDCKNSDNSYCVGDYVAHYISEINSSSNADCGSSCGGD